MCDASPSLVSSSNDPRLEQAQGDIGDAEAGIESAKQGVTKLSKELNRLQAELKQEEVDLSHLCLTAGY